MKNQPYSTPKWLSEPIFPSSAEPIAQEILEKLLIYERVFESDLCLEYPRVSIQNSIKKLCYYRWPIKAESLGMDDASYHLVEPPASVSYQETTEAFLHRKKKNDGRAR